ncbi:MAG TPA: hypothetical protein VFA29_08200 [Candidatus Baltobacteraceae bacterium]|nr:hypothetical protein [Candidatus Baltobacteraceae bacterium]
MEASEAREHLEMVDAIIRAGESPGWASRQLGVTLVLFGLGAGLLDLAHQIGNGALPMFLFYGGIAALAAGLAYLAWWLLVARGRAERISMAQVRAGRVMGAVWWSVTIAAFCQPHLFSSWSAAAIWSLGAAIAQLVNGFFGDRRGLAGGAILLASMLVANYAPAVTGYALAAGFFFGYAGVGLLYLAGPGAADDCG